MTVGRRHIFSLDDATLIDGAQKVDALGGLPRRITFTSRGLFRFDGWSLADWYGGPMLGQGSTGNSGYSTFTTVSKFGTHALYFHNGWASLPFTGLGAGSAWGLSAWLRVNAANTSGIVLSSRYQGAGRGVQVLLTTPKTLRVIIVGDAGSIDLTYTMPFTTWLDNTYHHWALSYSGSMLASGVSLYIDGAALAPSAVNADNLTVAGANLSPTLGYNPSGGAGLGNPLQNTYMDSVFYRSGVLSEIDRLVLTADSPPLAHVRFTTPVVTPSKPPVGIMVPGGVRTLAPLGALRETRAFLSWDGGVWSNEVEIGRLYPSGAPVGGAGTELTLDLYTAGWVGDALGSGPTVLYNEADPAAPPTTYVGVPAQPSACGVVQASLEVSDLVSAKSSPVPITIGE